MTNPSVCWLRTSIVMHLGLPSDCALITSGIAWQAGRHKVASAEASPRLGVLNRRAKSSGRKTKIGSPTQLRACLFGRNVSVGLRDVIDARIAVVDGQQSGIGRCIHMNGRRI